MDWPILNVPCRWCDTACGPCAWPLSLSILFPRFFRVVARILFHSFLWPNNSPLYEWPTCVCLFINSWIFWLFPPFGSHEEWCCGRSRKFLVWMFPGHLGAELLCHVVTLYLAVWGPARLFPEAPAWSHVPFGSVGGLQFLHIATNTDLCVSCDYSWLLGVKCYLIVVLICLSLMTNGVDYAFGSLFTVCVVSSGKGLFWSFARLSIELFPFLLLRCKASLYILDTHSLSDIWPANILPFCG